MRQTGTPNKKPGHNPKARAGREHPGLKEIKEKNDRGISGIGTLIPKWKWPKTKQNKNRKYYPVGSPGWVPDDNYIYVGGIPVYSPVRKS